MSVASQIGVGEAGGQLLGVAQQRWAQWVERCPVLGVVDGVGSLPGWLRRAEAARADGVLLGLARLASPSGGDDVAAAGVLAWVLLPGASLVAYRLRALSPRIDELVAAALWVEVRSFPWEGGHKVAANIVMNTRRGVLRDLGVSRRVGDSVWDRCIVADPAVLSQVCSCPAPAQEPARLVVEVLGAAIGRGVVDTADCALLLDLAATADRVAAPAARGSAGLMSGAVLAEVGARRGISPSAMRRRARRSLDALSAAWDGSLEWAC